MLPDAATFFKELLNEGRAEWRLPPGGIPVDDFCQFVDSLSMAAKALGLFIGVSPHPADGVFALVLRRKEP